MDGPLSIAKPRKRPFCYIITHYIINPNTTISHTLDLDRHMLDRYMLYHPSQPRSKDVDRPMLYHQSQSRSQDVDHHILYHQSQYNNLTHSEFRS